MKTVFEGLDCWLSLLEDNSILLSARGVDGIDFEEVLHAHFVLLGEPPPDN